MQRYKFPPKYVRFIKKVRIFAQEKTKKNEKYKYYVITARPKTDCSERYY